MKHKESTADANYVIKVNAKRSSEAHHLMKTIITAKKSDDLDNILLGEDDNAKEESSRETERELADQSSNTPSVAAPPSPTSARRKMPTVQ